MTESQDPDIGDLMARCRALFLTDLWRLLIDEDRTVDGVPSWIESWFRGTPPGTVPADPTAGALHRILASGADPDDVTDVVRTMQHEIIYNICQLLDDPAMLGIRPAVDPDHVELGYQLTAVRTESPPARLPMEDLHSDLDSYDPAGRWGEPRGRPITAPWLPGEPEHARAAAALARDGFRDCAVTTWRAATGATPIEAEAAIDALLNHAAD
jgi:hypothetical protein